MNLKMKKIENKDRRKNNKWTNEDNRLLLLLLHGYYKLGLTLNVQHDVFDVKRVYQTVGDYLFQMSKKCTSEYLYVICTQNIRYCKICDNYQLILKRRI